MSFCHLNLEQVGAVTFPITRSNMPPKKQARDGFHSFPQQQDSFRNGCWQFWGLNSVLSPTTSPFCFSYFSGRVLYCLPGPAVDLDPPTSASCLARTTAVHHCTQLVCWDGVSLTFCLGRTQTAIVPISTSQVAGITGMSHHIQTSFRNFYRVPRMYAR
jgi:hypothetical protein